VQDLTFDGNRYDEYDQGLGLNCLATNYYVDLYLGNLGTTGQAAVTHVDFVNSPGVAVSLAGNGSGVSYCHFGMGTQGQQSASTTASRNDSIELNGNNSAAITNSIYWAGAAGISAGYPTSGTGLQVTFNTLFNDRYETPGGATGGSLYVDPYAFNTFVLDNVVNGNGYVYPSSGTLVNGCPVSGGSEPGGAELNGNGTQFVNNEIQNNPGGGIAIACGYTVSPKVEGIDNYFYEAPMFVEGNGWIGILIKNDLSGTVTIDNGRVRNNNNYGVVIQAGTVAFTDNACMYGNSLGNVQLQGGTATYSPMPFNFDDPSVCTAP
jgi:hypothetical protein